MTDEIKLPEPTSEHYYWVGDPPRREYYFTADQVRAAVLEAKALEMERLALAWEWAHGFDKYGVAAFIRSGHSITETKRD